MFKKYIFLSALAILLFGGLASQPEPVEAQYLAWNAEEVLYNPWNISTATLNSFNTEDVYRVNKPILAYSSPDSEETGQFELMTGMEIQPKEIKEMDNGVWIKFGDAGYWIQASSGQEQSLTRIDQPELDRVVDLYGILDTPHNYAVKLVKEEGAVGHMEIYRKIDGEYVFQTSYEISYRKEGMKDWYGDLKSPGGNVVRYMYRTTRSGMNGRDKDGESFGVYKISYPMPHDALPHVLSGKLRPYHYSKLPGIYYNSKQELIPHPHSNLGADIVLHTKNKGSRGCINVENEQMGFLYHNDLVTENDKEIIPLIIYDEEVEAPPVGTLM